ncbi:MAG: hypothetical protein NUW09_01540, partial [Deltaproteobacteria bacterium]|nr:hypothetical protein [Deltaproteobacteria bacterium]
QRPYWLDFVHPLKKGGFLTGNSGWIAVLDNSGNILWEIFLSDYKYDSKSAEDSPLSRLRVAVNEYKYDFAATVVELTDGDIILGGHAGQHIWMSRLSPGGKLIWNKQVEISGSCGLAGIWQYKEELRVIGSTCGTEPERIWGASFSISGDIKAVRKYLTADVNKGEIEQAVPVEDDKFVAFGGAKDGKENGLSIWIFKSSFNFDAVKEK